MEAIDRKPFQGILNIVRFNYPFYIATCLEIALLLILQWIFQVERIAWIALLLMLPLIVSLFVSWYVYDLSGLYSFKWFDKLEDSGRQNLLNIHAGFDETSRLIQQKFPDCRLTIADFYSPDKHTELSIKRARKRYPVLPATKQVETNKLPFEHSVFDKIFLLFAAHEIRNETERFQFFEELRRILKDDGEIVLMEHLRDVPNFIAYSIGFFHFFSKQSWKRTIEASGFSEERNFKSTPFVHIFILKKNGIAS